ncbi:MAG TPA: GtrA family protein [Candidatus Limnocylindrales bacterium]|nr:GtrA family protein [Candidatus Limnocylindrales bacterium]
MTVLASPSKFAVVGVLGIVVNQLALVILTETFGIYYLVSSILASQVSTLHNFLLTEFWVFRAREARGQVLIRYLVFNALNAATLLIRVPVLYLLTDHGGIHYAISNLVAIGLTFGIRYLIADNWIWAGRDQRAQRPVGGAYQYDVHGLVRVRSAVALPELAAFNVDHELQRPDLVVRGMWLGGWPRLGIATRRVGEVIRYREHLGGLGAAFDVRLAPGGGPIHLDANWLLLWSHHVLYTNMVEPLLRFLFVTRDRVLLHCAAIEGDRGALVVSAKTDTGKTSTVLRLLVRGGCGFLSDDMAIVGPDGILGYPKPLTLSSHTMSAVNEQALPAADRVMLSIRSTLHSREGRAIGHALGRLPIPIVTVNAWVQLFIPPPKYHVTSLVECDVVEHSTIDAVVVMERGEPLAEQPAIEAMVDELLQNTEDAYTFPPFGSFSPLLVLDGLTIEALRARERELLWAAIAPARRLRLRVRGHNWSELLPLVLAGQLPTTELVARLGESAAKGPPAPAGPAAQTGGPPAPGRVGPGR